MPTYFRQSDQERIATLMGRAAALSEAIDKATTNGDDWPATVGGLAELLQADVAELGRLLMPDALPMPATQE